jgi:hypothetical protein
MYDGAETKYRIIGLTFFNKENEKDFKKSLFGKVEL